MKLSLIVLVFVCINSFAHDFSSIKFRFPISDKDRHLIKNWPIYGFDHNKKDHRFNAICKNYKGRGFPNCYDEHKGTDFMLKGGFRQMDRGSAEVVAAQSGVVIDLEDGHYDRCRIHWLKFRVTCHQNPMEPNYVTILHWDGTKTRYLHLKKHSIQVTVGQNVECGQKLGLIGSSGRSSAPHLHFDVFDLTGQRVDPYSGKYSQEYSYWLEQKSRDKLPGGACN